MTAYKLHVFAIDTLIVKSDLIFMKSNENCVKICVCYDVFTHGCHHYLNSDNCDARRGWKVLGSSTRDLNRASVVASLLTGAYVRSILVMMASFCRHSEPANELWIWIMSVYCIACSYSHFYSVALNWIVLLVIWSSPCSNRHVPSWLGFLAMQDGTLCV